MYITEILADRITSINELPPSASDATRRCILDAVSSATAGQATPAGKAAREGSAAAWGRGPVPMWFSERRSTEIGAAFANAAAVCLLDIDDGHRVATGHAGASVVPAVLAAVHADPSLAPRAETAIAIGYEIGLRIAVSRDIRKLATVCTGRWAGQGVAAAVGWLKGMSPHAIAEAIAATASVAPLMEVAEFTDVGHNVKEATPYATVNGLTSLPLAAAGFRAPLDVLDDPDYFDRESLLSAFGERWMIEEIYFKPYSCCRWVHAPIDGMAKIIADNDLSAGDITSIRINTFDKALTLNNQVDPDTLEAAQFSIPFCLGVLAIRGAQAFTPMTDPTLLHDPDIVAVASRVDLVFDAEMDSYFPGAVPSRITITAGDTYTETVVAPLGELTNPLNWAALFEKFHALASASGVSPRQEEDLRRALEEMRAGSLEPLLTELARPVMAATYSTA